MKFLFKKLLMISLFTFGLGTAFAHKTIVSCPSVEDLKQFQSFTISTVLGFNHQNQSKEVSISQMVRTEYGTAIYTLAPVSVPVPEQKGQYAEDIAETLMDGLSPENAEPYVFLEKLYESQKPFQVRVCTYTSANGPFKATLFYFPNHVFHHHNTFA